MNQKLVIRILALLLVLAMVLGMIPLVFADEGNLGSGTPDGEPPVLERIELSAYDVTAPGEIEVTAYATDDVSGAEFADIWFYCKETGKEIACYLRNWYHDYETGEMIRYPAGILKGTLEFDSFVESGSFYLKDMCLQDAAHNQIWYNRNTDYDDPYWCLFPQQVLDLRIHVTAAEVTDNAPPVLERIEFSSTDVNAPYEIEVTVHASDDVSGLNNGSIWFYCDELQKELYCHLEGGIYEWVEGQGEVFTPYSDGTLKGTLEIDKYVPSGSFYIQEMHICDFAENCQHYDRYERNEEWNDPEWKQLPQDIMDLRVNVTESDTPDYAPPVLERIEMSVDTIAAPGEIEVTLYVSDDVSGAEYADLWFISADAEDRELAKKLTCHLQGGTYEWVEGIGHVFIPYPDGTLRGTLEIDQYAVGGSYKLMQIQLRDGAENIRIYDEESMNDDPMWCKLPQQALAFRFHILNAVPDVTTSVSKGEFVDQIANAGDDAYIVADFSGEATLPETAFDAISGTDKTLDLVSEGVTWRFNGNDIVNESKPIDLNVNITRLEESPSAEIQEKLDDTPAVVMKFAENGELPGKATIQVKVDYAMRQYLGASRELCVYYFNNQTGKLELIAENLMVINDTYIEFPITHCSYYILSTKIEEPAEPEHEYQYGDANHDGRVNVSDAVAVMKHRAGALSEKDIFCDRCANVDTNPKINVSDAVLIMKKRANKDMLFPIEMQ